MRRYILILLLILSSTSFSHGAGQPPLSPVWFQHVRTPMPLPPGRGEKIAATLRSMLFSQKNDNEILAAMPDDPNPRIVFIALGDGEWPERIVFDTGETFREALKNTLISLRRKEKKYAGIIREQQKRLEEQSEGKNLQPSPRWQQKLKTPNQWNSLRITIVQQTRQYENFSIPLSKVLLTNLNGIAFPRSAGFAFPPEQMTGRYLFTPEHFFNSNQIGNILSESENFQSMSTWLQLTTSAPPFPVILFDCASFFADSAGAVRLFHSHSAASPSPTAANLLHLARTCGQRLLPSLAQDGKLKSPFPEWISSGPDGEHPSLLAELSIAYSRLHATSPNLEFTAAAAKINRGLLNYLKKYRSASGQYQCLVEKEILDDPDNPQEPRKIADTHTNAMAALAFLEYTRCTGKQDFLPSALALLRHLTNVQKNNGTFRPVFVYPEMKPPAEDYFTALGETELTALSSLVMIKYQELAPSAHPELLLETRIRRSLNHICRTLRKYTSLHEIPPSMWIAEYLAAANKNNQKELQTLLGRIAIAANLNLDTRPVLPDLFGSIRDNAGMTLAAQRTRLTAAAARSVLQNGHPAQAKILLSASWMQIMFQLQGFMDRATASPLPQPNQYVGFFRDNLDSFSFNLQGQITQMLSLLELHEILTLLKLPAVLPESGETADAWEQNRARILQSPFLLTSDLIINNARSPESVRKISGNIQGTATTTKFQARGGRIQGANKNPSGTVLQKKKSPGGSSKKRSTGNW